MDAEMDLVRALFLEEEMNDFEFLQKLFINWDTIKNNKVFQGTSIYRNHRKHRETLD